MTDPTPQTPTRDEAALREAIREKIRSVSVAGANNSGLASHEIDEETDDLLADITALLTSAPAPASGGVDAAFTVASNLLRDGCTYADRKAAADFIRSALSPAATPVSEAEPVGWIGDLTLQRLGNGQEGKIYPTNPCPTALWSMPVYLAKPASSPAVGDVREACAATCDVMASDEDQPYLVRTAAASLAAEIRAGAALSQSTSAGRVGE